MAFKGTDMSTLHGTTKLDICAPNGMQGSPTSNDLLQIAKAEAALGQPVHRLFTPCAVCI